MVDSGLDADAPAIGVLLAEGLRAAVRVLPPLISTDRDAERIAGALAATAP